MGAARTDASHVHTDGNFVLMGTVRKVGAAILKSVSVEGMVPVMRWLVPSIV